MKKWKEPKRVMWEPVDIDSEPLLHGSDETEASGGFHFSNSTLKRTKKIRGFDNINFMLDSSEEANGDYYYFLFFFFLFLFFISFDFGVK